mgnify:CR=1 FL=1
MAGPARLRSSRLLLASLVALSLITITLDFRSDGDGPLDAASRAFASALAPLQRAVTDLTEPIGGFLGTLLRLPEIRRENATLRDRVAELEERLATAGSDASRLAELEALLGVRSQLGTDVRTVAARVIASGVSNFEWSVQIDRGTADGLAVGMPVLSSAGLVGRIVRASDDVSTVQLILDPGAAVAGRLGASGATGIVTGEGDRELRMGLVDTTVEVTAEDAIVTAGYEVPGVGANVYPPGILIGQVSRVLPNPTAIEAYITVRPAVDFTTLDLVLVVLSSGAA